MVKVSFIVPIFNGEDHLGWCLNSVVSQTFRDIEILLINDGSTDNSLEICNNYAQIDDRIKVFDTENRGISCARNLGLDHAVGEYIQFLDCDDVIDSQMTEMLLSAIETYEKDLVICGTHMVEIKDEKIVHQEVWGCGYLGNECVYDRKLFLKRLPSMLCETVLMEGNCNCLYRKEIFDKYAIKFPEAMNYGEDFYMNLNYYHKSNGAVFLNKIYYYYICQNKNSASKKYIPNLFENQMRQLTLLYNVLASENLIDQQNIKYFNTYLIAQILKCFYILKDSCCPLGIKEKKAVIAKIVNHEWVRNGFSNPQYIIENHQIFVPYVMNADVAGILACIYDPAPNDQMVTVAAQRSLLNKCFAGVFLFAGKLMKWNPRYVKMSNNIASYIEINGVINTIAHINYKLRHRKKNP